MIELNKEYFVEDSYIIGSCYKILRVKKTRNGKIMTVKLLKGAYINEPSIVELKKRGLNDNMLEYIHDYENGRSYDVYVYDGKLVYCWYNSGKVEFRDASELLSGYRLCYGDRIISFDIRWSNILDLIDCTGNNTYWFGDIDGDGFRLPIVNKLSVVNCNNVYRFHKITNKYTTDQLFDIWYNGHLLADKAGNVWGVYDNRVDIDYFNHILSYIFNDEKLQIREVNIDIGGINI